MRSVLEFAGFFLFLGYRVVMLPVLSVLYALLAVVFFCNYCLAAYKQVALLLVQSKNNLLTARAGLKYFQKWSLSNLWHKTWVFSNHSN
jgi:hypothetical protein